MMFGMVAQELGLIQSLSRPGGNVTTCKSSWPRTAAITAKKMNGADPAQVPVEAPTVYELWINLRSARALGIKIPGTVRIQASRIIE